MINDRAVQRYIVNYIQNNPAISLYEAIRSIHKHLQFNFIPGEIVFLKSANLEARVLSGGRGVFRLEVYGEEGHFSREATFDEIERIESTRTKHVIQFLDTATKISPSGRVFKKGILKDGGSTMELFFGDRKRLDYETMSLSSQSLEHYYFQEEMKVCVGKKRKYDDLNTLLTYTKCPRISVKGIDNMPLFMEVFVFFATFKRYLSIDLSFEELVVTLLDKNYSSDTAFCIHAKLLSVIKKKLKVMCKYEAWLFFEAAADICIDTSSNEEKTMKAFRKYNWNLKKVTASSWKKVLHILFSYICNELKISKVAHFKGFFYKSCHDIDTRLNILKFLIECACTTKELKRIVSSKALGRRRKKGAKYSTKDENQDCGEPLEHMQAKYELGLVDGVYFIFAESNIFFVRLNCVFQMHICHMKVVLHLLVPKTHNHRKLKEFLNAYIRVFDKQL